MPRKKLPMIFTAIAAIKPPHYKKVICQKFQLEQEIRLATDGRMYLLCLNRMQAIAQSDKHKKIYHAEFFHYQQQECIYLIYQIENTLCFDVVNLMTELILYQTCVLHVKKILASTQDDKGIYIAIETQDNTPLLYLFCLKTLQFTPRYQLPILETLGKFINVRDNYVSATILKNKQQAVLLLGTNMGGKILVLELRGENEFIYKETLDLSSTLTNISAMYSYDHLCIIENNNGLLLLLHFSGQTFKFKALTDYYGATYYRQCEAWLVIYGFRNNIYSSGGKLLAGKDPEKIVCLNLIHKKVMTLARHNKQETWSNYSINLSVDATHIKITEENYAKRESHLLGCQRISRLLPRMLTLSLLDASNITGVEKHI